MNVLFVSQCSKNALSETRRILDQFAERRGDRTWQTPITRAGLDTLRRLLRKSARKNTAVACHWIRGHDHSELLWIVGDASRFNAQGATPTNTTSRDVLRQNDENDWHTGEDILLLAGLAALMHDLGKACLAFQNRLVGKLEGRNLYRHEWISLRLFAAFVGNDDDAGWLGRLLGPGLEDDDRWLQQLQRDGLDDNGASPFRHLPPLAAAVGWLIVTHHRLPMKPGEPDDSGRRPRWGVLRPALRSDQLQDIPAVISADWNEVHDTCVREQVEPYWCFEHALPVTTSRWRERAGHLARRLLERLPHYSSPVLDNPYVMHLARLSLMLADHYYSGLEESRHRVRGERGYPLYANTDKAGVLKQPLDEHLLGVEKHSAAVSRALPSMARHLPRLARHKGFRKRSDHARFRWQDKAFDLARSIRERSERQGFFGINMASTGCGKTLANGRILYALADPEKGARFSVALGLRTLTLQTGQAYRERLNLGEDELAVRVGGGASRALFEHYEQQAERTGSASAQSLMEEDGHVTFDDNFDAHPVLRRLNQDPNVRNLIAAPILVCTVDHLIPATEGTRGGRQIAPMLRLMSSDLVLDEIDDFDIDDLPALTRLVHWSGLLGSRVLLSSATLPPSLVRGLFEAYRDGREQYQKNRGEPGCPVEICCAWFDEHDRHHETCSDGDGFSGMHQQFAKRRHQRLAKAEVLRRSEIGDLKGLGQDGASIRQSLAECLRDHAERLHDRHHSVDPHGGRRVSFGLIRMANIDPIFDVALALYRLGARDGRRIHLCVYHSQHALLVRSEIERCLDRALDRRDAKAVFEMPDIRRRLDAHPEQDQLFIVLGSPVTEVGRDHDYDWAVVEPSSMRSIIQLAGRVRRHREAACDAPNMVLLDTNLKHLERPSEPAFCRPGFETAGDWRLNSHSLHDLMRPEEWAVVDARPRILERQTLRPHESLVDLEHERLRTSLLEPLRDAGPDMSSVDPASLTPRERKRLRRAPSSPPLGAYSWYRMPRLHLLGVMPQCQPFRYQSARQDELALLPDESGEDWILHLIQDSQKRYEKLYVPVEKSKLERIDLADDRGPRIQPWGTPDYLGALVGLADAKGMALENAARTFGVVTLPESAQGWRFHPALGFSTRR
ncbi:type I-F CRISPR-associated helicase Cas3f [Alloalcanivorax xenomutans]|uniref:Type I-F CRISPR-associated helicase Cas3f n=1 Tax=Alloalcanivorax xenomutans TaxID=1094342 RepID=A0A9Q3W5R6_9GAMM|nr:type I-F CRISPR-associated helicase Cas3f [Alloalcanivorax xenomutans]MCE7509726.1 type I-F CRISPR-associated helicase Cas3f [Alloalcanivorax xenomutans]